MNANSRCKGLSPLKYVLWVGLIQLTIVQISNAALVEYDYFNTGDGLLTHDTNTDLYWLDVSATQGLSTGEVLDDADGWLSRGFRYANEFEIRGLFIDYLPVTSLDNARHGEFVSAESAALGRNLVEMLGVTYSAQNSNYRTFSLSGAGDIYLGNVGAGIGSSFLKYNSFEITVTEGITGPSEIRACAYCGEGAAVNDHSNPLMGNFLVLNSEVEVPEPETVLLFLLAAMPLLLLRKRPLLAK